MNLQNQPLTETSVKNDPFYGHLNPEEIALYESTPIFPTTTVIRGFLSNLPIYRSGVSTVSRGLEIGMAHGYFLLGPFTKLGPLRNSDLGLEMGLYSTFGLVIILTIAMLAYGSVQFSETVSQKEDWNILVSGFAIGGLGGAIFGFFLLTVI
nr:photosystem I reaction center subunit XI [Meringosphaera mediterranea]